MKERKTSEWQYVQQHLANERTFLAWVRTAITIVGLGFLAAGVVFRSPQYEFLGHWIAAVVGVGSIVMAVFIIICAASDYFRKQRGINANEFYSPRLSVWITFASLGLLDMLLLVLVIVLLLS